MHIEGFKYEDEYYVIVVGKNFLCEKKRDKVTLCTGFDKAWKLQVYQDDDTMDVANHYAKSLQEIGFEAKVVKVAKIEEVSYKVKEVE